MAEQGVVGVCGGHGRVGDAAGGGWQQRWFAINGGGVGVGSGVFAAQEPLAA